jgi:hypothetical protein
MGLVFYYGPCKIRSWVVLFDWWFQCYPQISSTFISIKSSSWEHEHRIHKYKHHKEKNAFRQ